MSRNRSRRHTTATAFGRHMFVRDCDCDCDCDSPRLCPRGVLALLSHQIGDDLLLGLWELYRLVHRRTRGRLSRRGIVRVRGFSHCTTPAVHRCVPPPVFHIQTTGPRPAAHGRVFHR